MDSRKQTFGLLSLHSPRVRRLKSPVTDILVVSVTIAMQPLSSTLHGRIKHLRLPPVVYTGPTFKMLINLKGHFQNASSLPSISSQLFPLSTAHGQDRRRTKEGYV